MPPVAPRVSWKNALFLGACAGGMGWGIRGQYGHETGAMMAGLLVSLTLTLLFCPGAAPGGVLRAVAWGTVAMGFGGSMTYGQTVGLTHDKELVGNAAALLWGMLGLAIKGGLWIGFAGVFFGMGLSEVRYRTLEVLLVFLAALGFCALGIWLLNEPFDPANRVLPRWYFSDDWRWEPDAALKPRREVWGGFLFALATWFAWIGWRRDRLALRLGGWAIMGGALGFPLGQCLQAGHAWNLDFFQTGFWGGADKFINWWNFMETTFGAVMGAALGLGLWFNRQLIRPQLGEPETRLPAGVEWPLLALHGTLLVLVEFSSVKWVDALYDFGLMLGFLPVVLITMGRWAPALFALPLTALPLAGKTLRRLAYEEHVLPPALGWMVYLIVPMGLAIALAIWVQRRSRETGANARTVLRPMLLFAVWLYFGLNYAFFHFPWPWAAWTTRTPNALVYTFCLGVLTWHTWRSGRAGEETPNLAESAKTGA